MVEKLVKKKKGFFEIKVTLEFFFLFHIMKLYVNDWQGIDIKFMKILELCWF